MSDSIVSTGRLVKLPNANVVQVNELGFMSVVVPVEIWELISNDLEWVLDILSLKATGTTCLNNISYEVVRNTGNTLYMRVTGQVDLIEDLEEFNESQLPEVPWTVQVCRIGFGFHQVELTARSEAEARAKADAIAGDLEYRETVSDYSFEATPR
jgi:hypothetical protein